MPAQVMESKEERKTSTRHPVSFFEGEPTEVDPHLRSAQELLRYKIKEDDRFRGHIADFSFDSESWTVDHALASSGVFHKDMAEIDLHRIKEISWRAREIIL